MKTGLLAAALLIAAAPAFAADQHTIESIDNNNVVTLDNGDQYQANDDTVQNWQNGDTVIVPDSQDRLINNSRGNEE
jgi:hypothetical protein